MGMIDLRMRQTERVLSGVLCAVLVWPAAAAAQRNYTRAQEEQFHRAATRALAHGAYDEARELADTRDPADPSAAALLARLDVLGGDYAAAESRLEPIAVPENAWYYSAREMIALLHIAGGEVEAAKPLLTEIADDNSAPAGMRARASEILKAVGA